MGLFKKKNHYSALTDAVNKMNDLNKSKNSDKEAVKIKMYDIALGSVKTLEIVFGGDTLPLVDDFKKIEIGGVYAEKSGNVVKFTGTVEDIRRVELGRVVGCFELNSEPKKNFFVGKIWLKKACFSNENIYINPNEENEETEADAWVTQHADAFRV